jgi:hypothetical protein
MVVLGSHELVGHFWLAGMESTSPNERCCRLLEARCGPGEGVCHVNSRHIKTRKPRNINDIDMQDGTVWKDMPVSQPTDMSYFLQRLRLAEVSRNIIELNPAQTIGPGYDAHTAAMDRELDQMMSEIPSFFNLNKRQCSLAQNDDGMIVKAYLLNSLMHGTRCKLHLSYLTAGPGSSPAFSASRYACLRAARQLIRAEALLEQSRHPFVQIRLRLPGILYSVYVATIVLLMDAHLDGLEQSNEVAEALEVVRRAGSYSVAAANLHHLLTQIQSKDRAHQQEMLSGAVFLARAGVGSDVNNALKPTRALPGSANNLFISNTQPLQQGDALSEPMELGLEWEDLFSNLDSSSFF